MVAGRRQPVALPRRRHPGGRLLTVEDGAEGAAERGESALAVTGPRSEAPPATEVGLTALDTEGEPMTVLSP
ncbi:hypothetical protein BDW27_103444 [Nocardiopsis sp. L17-MgMaSL7]|nr:hypothetical protein BDW27_103444 [Nocardiopsis sp. L17-MgMaSL7]